MKVGYARVSTPDQNIQTQIDLLQKEGCDKIYTDIGSGVKEDRNGLNEMLSYLRKGDIVITYKNDRIFRSLKNMITLIDKFAELGVHFKSLSEPEFDSTSANGKFLLHIFSAVAEFERNLIIERTKSGLATARLRNKNLGRPKGAKEETIERYRYAKHLYENEHFSIEKACKKSGIGKTTFYRLDNQRKE